MTQNKKAPEAQAESPVKCGIIMPISAIDGCPAEHWVEVHAILKDVINDLDYESNLVSDAEDIGIIQKRIIHNIYNSDIIVCDVSGKNPNVMFELGMRLAFDKPTVIVKDDKTDYSFDTSVIEHLTYPRDLRFSRINEFKDHLSKKLKATYEKAKNDPKYSTFLKNFGQYKVAHLQEKEVSSDEYIMSALVEIKSEIGKLKSRSEVKLVSGLITPKEKEELIKSLIHSYQASTKLSDIDIFNNGKEDLCKYIIKQPGISGIFHTRREIMQLIDEMILPF